MENSPVTPSNNSPKLWQIGLMMAGVAIVTSAITAVLVGGSSTSSSEATTTTVAIITTTIDPNISILSSTYKWKESSSTVSSLQTALGIKADGIYGKSTRTAHLAELQRRGLSESNVPSIPVRQLVNVTVKKIPYDSRMYSCYKYFDYSDGTTEYEFLGHFDNDEFCG